MSEPNFHKNQSSIRKISSTLKKILEKETRTKISTSFFNYIFENKWESLAIFLGISAFVLSSIGFYQMFEANKLTPRIIDSIYNTFRVFLFDMERPDPDTPLPWSLEIARWIAPFVTTFYAGKAVMYLFRDQLKLLTLDGGHIIICGAGEKGRTLGMDWLKKTKDETHEDFGKKLIFIEPDPANSNIETLQEAGAIVVMGKAQEELVLEKVKVDEASYFVTVTDHDTTNMEIISTLTQMLKGKSNKPKCYIHLLHSEFYDFFSARSFSDIKAGTMMDIKIFNIYNNSARMLFRDKILGENVFDSVEAINSPETTVKLAILGFGKLGENALLQSLHLGHFYNEAPIDVTVVYDHDRDENKNILDEFTKQFNVLDEQYNGHYWNVKFIDDGDFFEQNMDYTQIIVAYEDEFESLSNLMKLLKRYNDTLIDNNVDVSIYSNSFEHSAAIIQKDKLEKTDDAVFKQVRTFGELNKTCNYDMVIDQELDKKAILNNEHYNELHGYYCGIPDNDIKVMAANMKAQKKDYHEIQQTVLNKAKEKGVKLDYNSWDELGVFLKDSNRYLMEHNKIKKLIIDKFTEACTDPKPYESTRQAIYEAYFFDNQTINWDDDAMGVQYSNYATHMSVDEIVTLAQVEHKRWNAFHILNGWKVMPIKKLLEATKDLSGHKAKDGKQKHKIKKLHACIVSWEELDKVSEAIEHNYKSDDIETIMRIPSLERALNNQRKL